MESTESGARAIPTTRPKRRRAPDSAAQFRQTSLQGRQGLQHQTSSRRESRLDAAEAKRSNPRPLQRARRLPPRPRSRDSTGERKAPLASSPPRQKLFDRHSNIARNLPQQRRRYVPATMIRHCRPTAIRVAKLHVRPALPNAGKAQTVRDSDYFARFENRSLGHVNRQ